MDNFSDIKFEINFSDLTMLEANGLYKDVNKLIESDTYVDNEWMVRTELTIMSVTTFCSMVLHFYHNKDIYIIEYQPSIGDVFYNPDIQCLSVWAQENGWNIPQPYPDLVRDNLEFWKHFWETYIVNSDYLDKKYGIRQIDFSDNNSEE